MDPRTQERVEQWDSRPFSGGYDELSDLADRGFSGSVSAAGTWLFMLNGRVVGVFDGDIEDFENASGTIYDAPHPSLPLLCSMKEQGGETQAKYYTNDTPLREVDETLQDGSFTGYVELSENVLSGDYYAVYYGGRRMAAAFIGNAERLVTGDEAFERAADEVGIYEVMDVDVDVTDVPGSDGGTTTGDAGGGGSEPTTDDGASSGPSDDAVTGSSNAGRGSPSADPSESAIDPIDISGSEPSVDDPTIDDGAGGITATDAVDDGGSTDGITADSADSDPSADSDATVAPPVDADAEADDGPDSVTLTESTASSAESATSTGTTDDASTTPTADAEAASTESEDAATAASGDGVGASSLDPDEVEAAAAELDQNDISWTDEDREDSADNSATKRPSSEATEGDESGLEERFEEEEQWRETKSIPSIDPDKTADGSSEAATTVRSAGTQKPRTVGKRADAASGSSAESRSDGSAASAQRQRARRSTAGSETASRSSSGNAGSNDETVQKLTQRVERLEEKRDEIASKAEELAAERDRLKAENEELTEQVQQLQSRIDDLETELEEARQGSDSDGHQRSTVLEPDRALSGTNLFVRYGSKSDPTLETAHQGEADQADVAANLRLEHHTEFDASDVAVDGRPYEEFLPETMEFRFVDWLTEVLLYEIRDTGHADGLGDLYDAIPAIDRAELHSTISLADDDTEDVPDVVQFDIVAYDKRGNPLVLVMLNDSREPASEELLADLEEAASAVKANYPDLAAAIAVTSSYFEPGALDVTEQATSSGILSRGSKLSFVNLSRKEGYHLCLVESRSEGFHMTVPEL
ncbi:DUF7527 domain-containing protein [Halopiger goleimassiliensis]|uniref:DUF7527 domain-containing protein n=1 Tax=Halopiger goleimassiliensis TaxID=1293048 RepID=UPI00067768E2|nr:transcriptional regulator [Halopiger goleimassiliensis]